MIYKTSSIDIIEKAFKAITYPLVITAVQDNGSGNYQIKVCNIYHAQPGYSININSNDYKITDINAHHKTIYISGPVLPQPGTYNLYAPFFFHGTPIETGNELKKVLQAFNKTPMLWMKETFKDHFFDDPENALDRKVTCSLFFLTAADNVMWQTDDSYHNAIEPMHRLCETFLAKLRSQPGIFQMKDIEYDIINWWRFGVFLKEKGVVTSLWNDQLAGVELQIVLPILKHDGCECCETTGFPDDVMLYEDGTEMAYEAGGKMLYEL